MFRITVYHCDPHTLKQEPVAIIRSDKDTLVAALDDAWVSTNHVDRPWPTNPNVTMLTNNRVRSSMVGDLFEVNNQQFTIANFGFEPDPCAYTPMLSQQPFTPTGREPQLSPRHPNGETST